MGRRWEWQKADYSESPMGRWWVDYSESLTARWWAKRLAERMVSKKDARLGPWWEKRSEKTWGKPRGESWGRR